MLRMPIFWLSLLNLIMSMTAIFFAFFSKETIDLALGTDRTKFFYSALILGGILVIQILASALTPYLKVYYTGQTNIRLKETFFSKLLRSKSKATKSFHTGSLMNHLYSDIDTVTDGLLDVIPKLIFYVGRFIGAFVLLFFLDPIFSLALVGFGVFLVIASRLVRGIYKRRHHALQNAESDVRQTIQESLGNISVIKAFEAESHMTEIVKTKQKTYLKALMKKQFISTLSTTGMTVFFAAGYGLAIIIGAIRLSEGFITFGALTAMIQLVGHIQSPFSGLSHVIPKYYSMIASAERLITLDQLHEDVNDPYSIQTFEKLIIKNLNFSYDDKRVIDDLSTTITKGSIIRITGESGRGKTTFFKLLLGLIEPLSGELYLVSNKKQYPINEQSRHLFSYVPQGNFILSGTIRDNLCLYQDATEEQLIKACRAAEILSDILNLSQGFNTVLGEHGTGFSEGQVQRLAIARALLKDAPILLLDEISSALDQETEKKIFESIRQMTDKTVLLVSHRELDSKVYDLSLPLT
jgi:ATP-binding cassette subfamily B protein